MFGADASYFRELDSYKAKLLNLYKERTKAMTERENLRFNYLGPLRDELSDFFDLIVKEYDKSSASKDMKRNVSILLGVMWKGLKKSIPMGDLEGRPVSMEWGIPNSLPNVDCTKNIINIFSTNAQLLNDECYVGVLDKPFHKAFTNVKFSDSYTPESSFRKYFVYYTPLRDMFTYIELPMDQMMVEGLLIESKAEWLKPYINPALLAFRAEYDVKEGENVVGRNLYYYYERLKKGFKDLVTATDNLMKIQQEINSTDESLKKFVAENASKETAVQSNAEVKDVLKTGEEEKKVALSIPPQAVEEKSYSVPIIAAIIAAGMYFFA